MLKEQTFDTGPVRINYAEGPPSGSPLVLLHGGGDRWQGFLPILPALTLRWHVFALDLRGHGKSGRVPGQYRPEHYAADVVTFLERTFTQPVSLLGHSLGGWIALLVAARQAERVGALILGDPPLDLDRFLSIEGSEARIGMWRRMRDLAGSGLPVPALASVLAGMLGLDAVSSRAWAGAVSEADPDVIQYHAEGRLVEYVAAVDLETLLQRMACPVLLLQADEAYGGVVSDEDVERAMELLADGLHVWLEGAGHDLGLSTWDVAPLLRAVTGFLESL